MAQPTPVFLSYAEENRDAVEVLARRLRGDARLVFWFRPWHSVPGEDVQTQMERALSDAGAVAVFLGGGAGQVRGWQSAQMRSAIQLQVEERAGYRVIPVLLPGVAKSQRRELPLFLQNYEPVVFSDLGDEQAFRRLLAGILGIAPVEIEDYLEAKVGQEKIPPAGLFAQGHALLIAVSDYAHARFRLPGSVANDAQAMHAALTSPACGYEASRVTLLLNEQATAAGIRRALGGLAARVGPDDTAVVFFSGHGAHIPQGDGSQQLILPFDWNPVDTAGSAIAGDELTAALRAVKAGRLLGLFDCCHSGGAAEPKGPVEGSAAGLSEDGYATLARGRGRVVIAACRPYEQSYVFSSMANSLFTHYLLEGLTGKGPTLGDGYVRVFDLFRHVAANVAAHAPQHPIFKASEVEEDFPVALVRPLL